MLEDANVEDSRSKNQKINWELLVKFPILPSLYSARIARYKKGKQRARNRATQKFLKKEKRKACHVGTHFITQFTAGILQSWRGYRKRGIVVKVAILRYALCGNNSAQTADYDCTINCTRVAKFTKTVPVSFHFISLRSYWCYIRIRYFERRTQRLLYAEIEVIVIHLNNPINAFF